VRHNPSKLIPASVDFQLFRIGHHRFALPAGHGVLIEDEAEKREVDDGGEGRDVGGTGSRTETMATRAVVSVFAVENIRRA